MRPREFPAADLISGVQPRKPHPNAPPKEFGLERVVLTAGLAGFFIVGYFGIGLVTDPIRARELVSPLDVHIPFIACSIWVYLWVFPAALTPLFFVRCPRLFRRTALAYATVIAVSLGCFAAFPVTSVRLRAAPAMLDAADACGRAVAIIYSLDPPFNLFPSLHLSIAAIAAFSAWKASGRYGAVFFTAVALVGLSVCTVKQHFVFDVLGGFVLAALAGAVILHPYRPQAGTSPAYSWQGPATYLAFLIVFYATIYIAHLLVS
jgi:membrane-associated phospholipid phosphatase